MVNVRLQPGDALIYRPSSWMGRLIAIKSWSNYSHIEMVVGTNRVIAARRGGVGHYDIRWSELGAIVRPPNTFDSKSALLWFDRYANGQKYDVFGLLRFFTLGKQSTDQMFCSELATRFYREGGVGVFAGYDADLIPPGWYATLASAYGFMTLWSDGKP